MAQSVQAGIRGNARGSRHGELRIDDRYGRDNARTDQHHLDLVHGVGDDGDTGRLGAGARRRGDRDHGSHVLFDHAAHVVRDRAAACRDDRDGLHGVDAAAAAESDEVVAPFVRVNLQARLDHFVGGLAGDIGEDRVRSVIALEHILDLGHVAELDHEGIRDDEGLLTKPADGGARLCQSTCAGKNLRRN